MCVCARAPRTYAHNLCRFQRIMGDFGAWLMHESNNYQIVSIFKSLISVGSCARVTFVYTALVIYGTR